MHKKNYLTALLSILLFFQSVNVFSQQQKNITPGDRVRITTFRYVNDGSEKKYNKPITGDVISLNGDSLTLRRYNFEITTYLNDNISTIELSIERKNNTRKGAIIGAIAGAGFGLAINAVRGGRNFPADPYGRGGETSGFVFVGGMTFFGAILGFFPGAIIGKITSSEKWEEVPIENIRRRQPPFSFQGVKIGFSFRMRK